MKNDIEKEYKILVTEAQFKTLCLRYEPLNFIEQINTYYDTMDHQIQKLHGAMRIREKEGICIFTLKIPNEHGLMEHECMVANHSADVFSLPEIRILLEGYQIQGPFLELARCTTKRAVVADQDAELCFDMNTYHKLIDYEIEYEYKRDHDGLTKFNHILEPISLTYTKNCKSKIQRALEALEK